MIFKSRNVSILHRVLSMLLILCTVFSFAGNVAYASGSNQAYSIDTKEGLNGKVADTSTYNSYNNQSAWDAAPSNKTTTTYNGSIWTDKSVFAKQTDQLGNNKKSFTAGDGEFVEVFSALGSQQMVHGTDKPLMDVMFVIDISGSMGYGFSSSGKTGSRIYKTLTALNTAIDFLLELDVRNRFGIAVYGSKAKLIVPLDNYNKTGNYLSLNNDLQTYTTEDGNSTDQCKYSINVNLTKSSESKSSNASRINLTISNKGDIAYNEDTTSNDLGCETFMEGGVELGLKQFISQKDSDITYYRSGKKTVRTPVAILMTDGYTNIHSAYDWWNLKIENNRIDGMDTGLVRWRQKSAGVPSDVDSASPMSGFRPYDFARTVLLTALRTKQVNNKYTGLAKQSGMSSTAVSEATLRTYTVCIGMSKSQIPCTADPTNLASKLQSSNYSDYTTNNLSGTAKIISNVLSGKSGSTNINMWVWPHLSQFNCSGGKPENHFVGNTFPGESSPRDYLENRDLRFKINVSDNKDSGQLTGWGYYFVRPSKNSGESISASDINYIGDSSHVRNATDYDDYKNIFMDIIADVKTEVDVILDDPSPNAAEPINSLEYIDPIGEYMEVKAINTLILGNGNMYSFKDGKETSGSTTYKKEYQLSASGNYYNEDYPDKTVVAKLPDAVELYISGTRKSAKDPWNYELHFKIQKELLPITLDDIIAGWDGTTKTVVDGKYSINSPKSPLRLVYTVGIQKGVLDGTVAISDDYISSHSDTETKDVMLYASRYYELK